MSSVVVEYPVEVKEYQVFAGKDAAFIQLRGVETPVLQDPHSEEQLRRVASVSFSDSDGSIGNDFFTRGGFLHMGMPMSMLPAYLDMLRNERPLFLSEKGELSTTREPAGEGEDDADAGSLEPAEVIEHGLNATRADLARAMRRAAREAGVSIEIDNMATLFGNGVEVVATSIRGLEQRPATELPEGMLQGFVYLLVAESAIRPGFYTVNAQVTRPTAVVGSNPAVVQLIDADGEVALEHKTTIEVESLSIPADRPTDFRTVIATGMDIDVAGGECTFEICFWCNNGWFKPICLPVPIPTCLQFSATPV